MKRNPEQRGGTPVEPTAVVTELVDGFLAATGRAAEELRHVPNLARLLGQLVATAQAAYPRFRVSALQFVEHIGARLGDAEDAPRAFLNTRAADLYLAYACARGEDSAISEVERRHFEEARRAIELITRDSRLTEEIVQQLRARLFVADSGLPRIASYSGRGSLGGWVRMSGVRLAHNVRRGDRRRNDGACADDALLHSLSSEADAEVQLIINQHGPALRAAFRAALGSLSARDRNLLRLHYLDGLSIDQIGSVFHVHRATVARWLTRVRKLTAEVTRAQLVDQFRLSPSEAGSLLGLVSDKYDWSVGSWLERDVEAG